MRTKTLAMVAMAAAAVSSCDKGKEGAVDAAPSASAAPSAMPSASASAAPAPTASDLPNRTDCPKGSAGPGTFDKPCIGKGASRLMEAAYTNKTDDKGPQFRVVNKATLTTLYGRIIVYFYDKAGKQLDVKDADGKTKPYQSCAGASLFGGVMKPSEKALLTFSCVKKEQIPDGTAAIEGEVTMVGFADSTGEKNDFYWRNDDLAPTTRKKGGVK
jgi:hypothetical protein